MTPIGDVISDLLSRGDLPERLEARRDAYPIRAGDVLTWTGAGWECAARDVVLLPWAARRLFFSGALRPAEEQLCLLSA